MNQDTEFVYRNVANSPGSPESPDYIKVGSVSYSLGVSTYIDLGAANLNVIQIATTSFTLTGTTTSKDYTFGGVTDLSTYSHTFETSALGVSNTNVIS